MRNGGPGGPGGAAAAAASYVLCLQAAMSLARSPVGHISFLSLSLSLSLSSPKLNLNCLTYWVRPQYGMGCPLALRCCLLSFVAVRRVRPSRPRPWPGRGRRSRKRDTVAGGGKGGRTDGRTTGKCLDSRFSTAHYFYGPSMRRRHRRRLRRQPRRRHFPTARGQKTSHKETRRRREGRPLSRHRALAGEGSIRDRVQHWSHSMRQGKVGLSLYPMPLTSVTACYIHKRNALVRPRPSVRPSVHIGADGSCGGATKTVSPEPSRARGGGRGRGGVGVGGRTALQGGRGHDSSESGGDVTRGNTPAAAAAAGSDSSATTTTTTTTRRTLQAAPVATATSPLCHGRGRWDRLRRGRDGFNECTY